MWEGSATKIEAPKSLASRSTRASRLAIQLGTHPLNWKSTTVYPYYDSCFIQLRRRTRWLLWSPSERHSLPIVNIPKHYKSYGTLEHYKSSSSSFAYCFEPPTGLSSLLGAISMLMKFLFNVLFLIKVYKLGALPGIGKPSWISHKTRANFCFKPSASYRAGYKESFAQVEKGVGNNP